MFHRSALALLRIDRLRAAGLCAAVVVTALLVGAAVAAADAGLTVIASVPVSGPSALGPWPAVDPATNTVYVTNYGLTANGFSPGTVSVINGASNTVAATIATLPADSNLGYGAPAVDPATDTIYAPTTVFYPGSYEALDVIDGATNTVTGTIQVPGQLYGVAVNPVTNTVYALGLGFDYSHVRFPLTVYVIDGATNSITATIPIGYIDEVGASVAVDPGTDTVYVASTNDPASGSAGIGTVSVINGATNTVTATIPDGGTYPAGIAVDAATHTVYVANSGAPPETDFGACGCSYANEEPSTVSVIDEATNTVAGTIMDGAGIYGDASGIAVDPAADTVYVSNWQGSTLAVIDGATNTVTSTINAGGQQPTGVAVNPNTHTVYVTLPSGVVAVLSSAGSAQAQLQRLAAAVAGVGPGQSLSSKISAASADLAAGDTNGAKRVLSAFINEVNAQSGKKISQTQAAGLIAAAQQIQALIG